MKTIFTSLILVVSLSQAHVAPGSHAGKTADGSACEMVAGKTYFDKNIRHPLNERIEITVNGETYVVQHPAVISVTDKLAAFDHDHFHGVLPTKTGAKALVINMEHSDSFEGPSEYTVITHEYKNDAGELFTCKLKN